MKNNIVTQSQFYFSAFLSTLTALLFIDVNSSYQQIIYLAVASFVNLLVILLYKGRSNFLIKAVLTIYFFILSVSVMIEFIIFMNSAVKSGPYWVLILIITATILFTCVKGFEAISRAAVIITFFTAIFVLYIFASTVSKIQLHEFIINNTTGLTPALILIFPSALYASLGHTLKDSKKYTLIIHSICAFFIIGYMIFISSAEKFAFPLYNLTKHSHLGIFKGADFLLLSIITIGTIYFISLAICGVVGEKQNKAFNVISLLIISGLSLLCLYIREIREIFISQQVLLSVTIFMILALIVNSMYERVASQHKICNKSKKN